MALTESDIGHLMVSVADLEREKVLSAEQANEARSRITELSRKVRSSVNDNVNTRSRRKKKGSLSEKLPTDHEIRDVLPEVVLKDIGFGLQGKILIYLFDRADQLVTYQEFLDEFWPNQGKTQEIIGPRLQEIRNKTDRYIEIKTQDGGLVLTVKQNS